MPRIRTKLDFDAAPPELSAENLPQLLAQAKRDGNEELVHRILEACRDRTPATPAASA